MDTVSITDFRRTISDCISRVAFGGRRLLLKKNDKPVAAVVPIEDFELLQELYAASDRDAFEGAADEARAPLDEREAVAVEATR